MKNKTEINLKKFQSETLEEFLAQKASYGLKKFYKTDDKELSRKIEEEVEEERKEFSFMDHQLLNGCMFSLISFFNFLGKKADRNLKEEEYVSAVRKANEILKNKKYFNFIGRKLQKHNYGNLFQELFEIKIVKAVTNLLGNSNFEIHPDAKTFGYLALLVYSGNTDSINKNELAELQSQVYRSFLNFKTQKQYAENYEKTGFISEKHANQYKQKGLVGKALNKSISYSLVNFGEFIRNLPEESEITDKVAEILENSNIKNLLCSKFENEISEDLFEEELEAETIRIVTQNLLNEDLQLNLEIEKDERLFKLIVQTILEEGIANYCSATN